MVEGRVEICAANAWSTVCNVGWSTTDARVVCRQLGYSIGGTCIDYNILKLQITRGLGVQVKSCFSFIMSFFKSVPRSDYGHGFGAIALTNVQCSGTETRLTDCQASNFTITCSHSQDAGVQCFAQTGNYCTCFCS